MIHRDAWNGYSLDLPEGWRTNTAADTMIFAGDASGEAILVWPMAGADGSPGQMATRVAQILAGPDRTFQFWIKPGDASEACGLFSRESGRIRGVLRLQILPQSRGVLATGYQAPSQQLEQRRQALEQILASFRPIQPLAREVFIDPSEGAFSVTLPQGWRAQGGVDRARNPHGEGAVVWLVEDPKSQARVAQESLVIDMVGGSLMGALGGLMGMFSGSGAGTTAPPGLQFGGLPMQVFQGQHGWKSQPFMKVEDYCHKVLLPVARPMRPDLRLEGVLHDPALDELARQSLRPVEMQLRAPVPVETGLAFATYSERNTTFRECSILINWAMPAGGLGPQYWFCSMGPVLRAPLPVWDEMAPILEGIARSFKANQTWESREIAGVSQRMTQERIQAEAYRAQLLRETMDYCHKVDEDIRQHREASQAEINRGQFNLIAGKEDVADSLGQSYKVDSGWDRYWLKNGEIVGSRSYDLDTHLEANGWSRLQIF